MSSIARDIITDYAEYLEVHNNHQVGERDHWVPKARPLKEIGGFIAESWL